MHVWVLESHKLLYLSYGGKGGLNSFKKIKSPGIHMWGVNSTVTKHPDYFVGKKTSERCGVTSTPFTRRCDDTSWQKAIEFLCNKTPLFLREFSKKKSSKRPRNAVFDTLLMSCFQHFAADAAKKNSCILNVRFARFYSLNSFIH